MKFILTICLSWSLLFLTQCSVCSCKKVPCPAFNDPNFEAWFPYTTDQQIIFYNDASSDTISLYVEKSEAYEAKQGCFGANGGCIAHCYIYSNELSASYVRKLQISVMQPGRISFNLYQFNCQADSITDKGLVVTSATFSSSYFPSLNIGNTPFNNVQLIKKDTVTNNKYSGPYKIYFAKNVGVVAYETYPDLKTWIKQ